MKKIMLGLFIAGGLVAMDPPEIREGHTTIFKFVFENDPSYEIIKEKLRGLSNLAFQGAERGISTIKDIWRKKQWLSDYRMERYIITNERQERLEKIESLVQADARYNINKQ